MIIDSDPKALDFDIELNVINDQSKEVIVNKGKIQDQNSKQTNCILLRHPYCLNYQLGDVDVVESETTLVDVVVPLNKVSFRFVLHSKLGKETIVNSPKNFPCRLFDYCLEIPCCKETLHFAEVIIMDNIIIIFVIIMMDLIILIRLVLL